MEKHHTTEDSTTLHHRACAATTAFLAFLGEWLILLLTFLLAMFFIPLTPSFTLHSTSVSILNNITAETENLFTANLSLELHIDDSNPIIGSSIYYEYDDSFHASLFHGQENLSTFSLPQSSSSSQKQEHSSTVKAEFLNVSLMVDEWSLEDHDHGSCGYVYLDFWFRTSARFSQPMWPVVTVKDKLEGHCGEVKVQLCSSSSETATTVEHPFHAPCQVYSDVVHSVRLVLLVVLTFLLVSAVLVHLLVEHCICSSRFLVQSS